MKISFELLILTFGHLQVPFPHLPLRVERLLEMRAAYLFSTLSMDAAPAPASASVEAEADVAEPDDDADDADDDANDEAEARRKRSDCQCPRQWFSPMLLLPVSH